MGVHEDPGEGFHDVVRTVSDLLLVGIAHHIPQRHNLERADFTLRAALNSIG